MDKISDHPGFKRTPRRAPGLPLAKNGTPPESAGSNMVSMLTGCIVSHAMQHGTAEALDVAVSVMLSATIALDIGEEELVDILSFMPEARQKIVDGIPGEAGGNSPDPAS